jgi:hypothetical protein
LILCITTITTFIIITVYRVVTIHLQNLNNNGYIVNIDTNEIRTLDNITAYKDQNVSRQGCRSLLLSHPPFLPQDGSSIHHPSAVVVRNAAQRAAFEACVGSYYQSGSMVLVIGESFQLGTINESHRNQGPWTMQVERSLQIGFWNG